MELVALNFGDINVISMVGHGSTFFFRVPRNDPAVVLKRFLAHLESLPAADEIVSLFRITAIPGQTITDAARGLLASILRPTELLLDGPDAESLLLIGRTTDSDKWLERLRKSAGTSVQKEIEFEHMSSWEFPRDKEQIEEQVLEAQSMEAVHA